VSLSCLCTVFGILALVLAVLVPPLAVFMERGINKDFAINVLLTVLGYVPGIIHALWVVVTTPAGKVRIG
jgi:uncharacterized membrane protein YqaE (UPF0057 family)